MERAILDKYLNQEKTFGRKGMNTKYPSEFEVYMVALELVDGDGNSIEYFSFPVMPFQIAKSEPTRSNIKKTASGTTVISSDSPVPDEIVIRGDFGRGFKYLLNPKLQELEGVAFKGALSNGDSKESIFDPSIKTGFGATKILQSIISRANKLDKRGKPFRLYMYNMALSESYLVAVPASGLYLTQNIQKNMIWEYNLTLTILAPLSKVKIPAKPSSPSLLMTSNSMVDEVSKTASKSSAFLRGSQNLLDFMERTTKFDVSKYLSDFIRFAEKDLPNIVAFYKSGVDVVDSSFNMFDFLWRQAGEVDSMIDNYRNIFFNCEIWDLVDHFSEIQRKLDTVQNLGRWTRSSRANRHSDTTKVDYIQRQLESLEKISKNTGATSYDDEWVEIAVENNINEEKYTSDGGVTLSISFKNNSAFGVKNIVDSLHGETIYGKDIKKKMELTGGDYLILEGWDSLMQTFDTILSTMKGGIPEFPEDGTSSETIGSNMNIISFPSIFRDLLQMFNKDDRFTSVDLVDLLIQEDQVYMKIQAHTKIGEKLISNILL